MRGKTLLYGQRDKLKRTAPRVAPGLYSLEALSKRDLKAAVAVIKRIISFLDHPNLCKDEEAWIADSKRFLHLYAVKQPVNNLEQTYRAIRLSLKQISQQQYQTDYPPRDRLAPVLLLLLGDLEQEAKDPNRA
jgi:hypothetical protein